MKNYLPSTIRLSKAMIFVLLLSFSFTTLQAQNNLIYTVAGTVFAGFSGDGGLATAAQFNLPNGIAIDKFGTMYIADEFNQRIRKVYSIGLIVTYAGTGPTGGTGGYSGDGGAATAANINLPFGVCVDTFGNLFIADNQNYRIRKVNPAGIISTIAGTGIAGYTGDGTPATNSRIDYSHGITADLAGNVYFSDLQNNVVRKISTSGIITTVAGTGVPGFSGDLGPATNAKISTPRGLRTDAAGNLYIAEAGLGSSRIRKVDISGIISTFAGGGTGPDGGPATAALISAPWDIAFDHAGNSYIAEYGGNKIRKIDGSGIISTLTGPISGYGGDGCDATAITSSIFGPRYLAIDNSDNIYFSDAGNFVVRKLTPNHKPEFEGGNTMSFTICQDSILQLNTILNVIDSDAYPQDLTWSLLAPPAHGTATCAYDDTTTGVPFTPLGMWYAPSTGYTGTDIFSVVVRDCGGASDTTTISITIANCTLGNLDHASMVNGLNVYPNPSNGSFTVDMHSDKNEAVSISITDILGRKIFESNTWSNTPRRIDGFEPGVYFLSAQTRNNFLNKKIIVR